MILLDTHVWIWWLSAEKDRLSADQRASLSEEAFHSVGVSAISCWEVAMLVRKGRVDLGMPIAEWFGESLTESGLELHALSPEIAIESMNLPGEFHGDPADRIIAATARVHGCPLLTADRKILAYEHVETIG